MEIDRSIMPERFVRIEDQTMLTVCLGKAKTDGPTGVIIALGHSGSASEREIDFPAPAARHLAKKILECADALESRGVTT